MPGLFKAGEQRSSDPATGVGWDPRDKGTTTHNQSCKSFEAGVYTIRRSVAERWCAGRPAMCRT